jgi:hypothetical protein
MEPVGSRNFFSGIRDTQCGDPLAHRQKGLLHCANAYREAGFWGNSASDAVSIDKKVAQARFGVWDVTEGWIAPVGSAEVRPVVKDPLPA